MAARRSDLPIQVNDLAPRRIGDWDVYPDQGRLVGPGGENRVEPRAMHLLACLAARPGELVTHQDLLATVWHDAVVNEGALSRTVSELRRFLGDDARSPRYIETIYKRGYRLLARVEPLPERGQRRDVRRALAMTAACLALVLVAAGVARFRPSPATSTREFLAGRPLTTTPGLETEPALSPDGSLVAFCRWDEGRADEDIHLAPTDGGPSRPFAVSAAREMIPVFSPDGGSLAYMRYEHELQLVVQDLDSGAGRVVAEFEQWVWGLDWSPDGEYLAVATAPEEDAPSRLVEVALADGSFRPLTSPARPFGDRLPRYGPDGRLACVRAGDGGVAQVCLVVDGDARPLAPDTRYVSGLDWTADGSGLVISRAGAEGLGLTLLDPRDGSTRSLPVRDGESLSPSIALEAGSLVYEESVVDVDIMGLRLVPEANPPRAEFLERVCLVSTRLDYSASFSPDGGRIAFASGRDGSRQIWLCDRDGTGLRQVTEFPGWGVEDVRWAPDGRRVACSIATATGWAAAAVESGDGSYRVFDTRGGRFAGWSGTGDAVYVISGEGPDGALWRLPPDGAGPVLVADGAAGFIGEDPQGSVLYRRWDGKDIRRCAIDGADDVAFPGESLGDWLNADLAAGRLHFTCLGDEGVLLVRLDSAAARPDTLAHLPRGMGAGLSVSPDGGEFLVHGASRHERDIILVQDFRP